MNLKIIRVEDESRIIVNYNITDYVFQVQLLSSESWINAKALVANTHDLSDTELLQLYRSVLVANWELNEVTFSVDPDNGNIWCETDMPVDTSFENFEVEITSIPFGIKHFLDKIAPTLSFEVRDTSIIE
jgi:hypothetical protein